MPFVPALYGTEAHKAAHAGALLSACSISLNNLRYSYRVLCGACFLCIGKHMKSTCAQNQNKEMLSEGTVHPKIKIQFLIYPLPCLWKVR